MKIEDEFKIELADELFLDSYDETTLADVVKMIDGVINGKETNES
jgi:acyl carrier protein